MKDQVKSPMQQMMANFPYAGTVKWIGVRKVRKMPLLSVKVAKVSTVAGLDGDHYGGKPQGKRQVTFIQEEHLKAIAAFVAEKEISPGLLRRNIVVKGINLLAFKDRQFKIGTAIFEMTGLCHPCSRMEENLGVGGYNAVRGHGGITAKVVQSGTINVNDQITVIAEK